MGQAARPRTRNARIDGDRRVNERDRFWRKSLARTNTPNIDAPMKSTPLTTTTTTLPSSRPREAAKDKQHLSRVDAFSGMALSNLVMLAIVVACAATIGKNGPVTIESAADAEKGLQPAGGGLAKFC